MTRLLSILLFLGLYSSASALELSIETGAFKNDGKTYLETYVRILGQSAVFAPIANSTSRQASVELTIIISQGETIASFEKYVLNSPEVIEAKDFLDVKRFAIAPGPYVLKIEAVDVNDPSSNITVERIINVDQYLKPIDLSDIQLFGKVEQSLPSNPLAKNGIYMEPLSFGVVTEDISVLNIYTEVYNSMEGDALHFVKFSIHEGFLGEEGNEVMKKVKKLGAKATEPLVLQLPVDQLPSGNYRVEIEVFDKSQNIIDLGSVDFVRDNPAFDLEYWRSYNKTEDYSFVNDMTADELDYALRATSPIIFEPKKSLLNYIIKDAPINAKRKFLFSIWKEREPKNTQYHYEQYLTFAKAIDLEYNSNVGYGFETDRGYTFLRYGKPNNVLSIDQEVDAYPYEIWYYNKVDETNQTNVRFLFYNQSLVHNDYTLLHSTCRGERQDPRWEIQLYKKGLEVPSESLVDSRNVKDGWDRNARRYFNEF